MKKPQKRNVKTRIGNPLWQDIHGHYSAPQTAIDNENEDAGGRVKIDFDRPTEKEAFRNIEEELKKESE